MTEYRLISSDSHVTMPDQAWQTYLDSEFRDRAPKIERTDEGDGQNNKRGSKLTHGAASCTAELRCDAVRNPSRSPHSAWRAEDGTDPSC